MLTIYESRAGTLERLKSAKRITEQAVWLDLLNPTSGEEKKVERALKLDVPTREEQQEIEASSRLYEEGGAYFMTAIMLYQGEEAQLVITPVTFILAGERLVTVRYAEPRAFPIFATRCCRPGSGLTTGSALLLGLIETVVDRMADVIERIQGDVNSLSHSIFEIKGGVAVRQRTLDETLKTVGHEGEITSRARESCHSFSRLLTYLAQAANDRNDDKVMKARIKTAARDVASLTDQVNFISSKIDFLLDATLGMINIEQNAIIKIFSVAAVVFLPPTLIASIYGMNFRNMPELSWWFGYPLAIFLMILFAVLPYVYFKRKGWL